MVRYFGRRTSRKSFQFLGAFAKLWKATTGFDIPVCPSTRMKQLGSHWTEFHEISYLNIFRKSVSVIRLSLKSDKNNGYFTWRQIYLFFITSNSFILRMRNVADESCKENQSTHFTWSVRKVSDLWPGKRNWVTWSVGHLITLKVVPLGLHTLLPAVPPLLEACRKSLFRNGV